MLKNKRNSCHVQKLKEGNRKGGSQGWNVKAIYRFLNVKKKFFLKDCFYLIKKILLVIFFQNCHLVRSILILNNLLGNFNYWVIAIWYQKKSKFSQVCIYAVTNAKIFINFFYKRNLSNNLSTPWTNSWIPGLIIKFLNPSPPPSSNFVHDLGFH